MATTGAESNSSDYAVPFLINGESYHPAKAFDVVSPITGKVIHRCGAADVKDAEAAVNAAAGAFESWRKTTVATRRDILLKAADIVEKRREELVKCAREETGETVAWCHKNVTVAKEFILDTAGRISALQGSIPSLEDPDFSGLVIKEPYGVVLSIAPWNGPYILGTRAIVFPVAAGNTIVFKGTECAPRTMWSIASVFHEAGLPKGVINSLSHAPSDAAAVTSALITNPLVKKVNFTGSTAVGRIIGKLAGENLKPVVLELGGKAPAIVWEDADLDIAAQECAAGAFLNSGQICMSTERILVHKAIVTEFKKRFSAAIDAIFPKKEDALVLINSAAADKTRRLIKDATSKGAALAYGELEPEGGPGTHLRPMVLDKVTEVMDIYRTESFGPLASIYEIDSEEEAIRIANDTEYGLVAAVFTEDLRRGLRFARAIETGAVHINSMTFHDEVALPHGGAKSSGYGRFNAAAGLEEWTRTKNVTFRN